MSIRRPSSFKQLYIKAKETNAILASGPEAFMVHVDMHWDKDAFPTKAMFATQLIKNAIDVSYIDDGCLHINTRIKIVSTVGDLALKHHLITVNGADYLAKRFSRMLASSIAETVNDLDWLKYSYAISLAVSKLLSRLKFAKAYDFVDEKTERKQIEILREI